MPEWRYMQHGQEIGPVEQDVVAKRIQQGVIKRDDLVWVNDADDWKTVAECDALALYLPREPEPVTPPLTHATSYAFIGHNDVDKILPKPHPWLRYAARTLDYWLFTLFFGPLIFLVIPPPISRLGGYAFGVTIVFLFIFVEAGMVALWGTILGKMLLNIRVKNTFFQNLTYTEGLTRSFKVWLMGMGCGIPIVSLFTMASSFMKLDKDRTTLWDGEADIQVVLGRIGVLRIILLVVMFTGYIAFKAHAAFLQLYR